jgi:hypothetical protein
MGIDIAATMALYINLLNLKRILERGYAANELNISSKVNEMMITKTLFIK